MSVYTRQALESSSVRGSTTLQPRKPPVREALSGPGEPLPTPARRRLEARLGHSFAHVRVHADERAALAANAIQAAAYAVGPHIVFGAGRYRPGDPDGDRLLAHELAHVVQQGDRAPPAGSLRLSSPDQHLEREAERAAATPIPLTWTRQAPSARDVIFSQPSALGTATGGLPQLGSNDAQNIEDVMAAVDGISRVGDTGTYTTTFKGRAIHMTQAQRDDLVAKARRSLTDALARVHNQADYARRGYETQRKINEESPVTSFVVTTLAGARDLPVLLLAAADRADGLVREAQTAMAAGSYVQAGRELSESEKMSKLASELWRQYHQGIISAGETTITVLEYTRDASFITLGVLAIIATGGAAAGAAGAAGTTTTAFGVEVGTVGAANVISFGAPAVATLGGAPTQWALGDNVDWGRVGVELAASLILAKFGGKLSQGIFTRLVGNAAVASVGKIAFGRILSSVLSHEVATAFSTAVDQTYQELRYRNVTWDKFTDRLIDRMTDPKGLIVATLMGAVQAGAEAKLGGSRLTEITDPKGTPTGEMDVIRAGAIIEDKSAKGLGTVNPKTGRPFPGADEKTWAEKQVYDKTAARIKNLQTGAATRPAKGGSRVYPSVKELQTVRKYEFAIDADTPALRIEVETQLANLRKQFPDWTFTARYGVKK
jgi:hypothetical protein